MLRMAPEQVCAIDMFGLARWQARKLAISLVQLAAMDDSSARQSALALLDCAGMQGSDSHGLRIVSVSGQLLPRAG